MRRNVPYEYERILELLDAYWISEPGETYVEVKMHFEKENGETQDKTIRWRRPDKRAVPI